MSHSHKRVGLGFASLLILVGPFRFTRAGMIRKFQTPTPGAMSIIGDVCSPEHCLRYVAQKANLVDNSSLLISALQLSDELTELLRHSLDRYAIMRAVSVYSFCSIASSPFILAHTSVN
jgi:hypothetical protein